MPDDKGKFIIFQCRHNLVTSDNTIQYNSMLDIRITFDFLAEKSMNMKNIQNCMLNNILFGYFPERICQKKLFNV